MKLLSVGYICTMPVEWLPTGLVCVYLCVYDFIKGTRTLNCMLSASNLLHALFFRH